MFVVRPEKGQGTDNRRSSRLVRNVFNFYAFVKLRIIPFNVVEFLPPDTRCWNTDVLEVRQVYTNDDY